jgi:hypothetical protein
MKRGRGRPRKFTGVKDRKDFPAQLREMLPPVVEFVEQYAVQARYQAALEFAAGKHGISTRRLERLCADPLLRSLATEIVTAQFNGQRAVPLTIEYLPLPLVPAKRKRGRPRKK